MNVAICDQSADLLLAIDSLRAVTEACEIASEGGGLDEALAFGGLRRLAEVIRDQAKALDELIDAEHRGDADPEGPDGHDEPEEDQEKENRERLLRVVPADGGAR